MKKIILIGMLALTTALSYGQCPIDAKRNNGNPGECTAQLTLIFNEDPVGVDIDSIHVRGVKLAIALSFLDKVHVDGKWKLRYCLTGGNYPPIGLFLIWFRGRDPLNPCSPCFECNPLPLKITNFTARKISGNEVQVIVSIEDTDREVNRLKLKVSYDGKKWIDKAVIVPEGTGTYTITFKK